MPRNPDPRWEPPATEYAMHDDLPLGWRHPVTGRKVRPEDPALARLGIYLRRSRYIAGRSQQSVADAAHVPQGQISRFERALAPAMNVERLAWIEDALDGAFPVGYCPHDHICPWRKLAPRPTKEEEWAAEVRKQEELTRRFYPKGLPADAVPPVAQPGSPEDDQENGPDFLDLLVGPDW